MKVLQLVDDNLKHVIGYVYEAMNQRKKKIQNDLDKQEKKYTRCIINQH